MGAAESTPTLMGQSTLKFSWAKDLPTQAAQVSKPSIQTRAQHRLSRREESASPAGLLAADESRLELEDPFAMWDLFKRKSAG